MEEVQVDAQDRPVREITIERMEVINDPFEEFDTRFKRKLKHEQDASLPNTHSHKKAKEFSQVSHLLLFKLSEHHLVRN